MKYLLCLPLLLLFSKLTTAQDTIVKTDGTRIIAVVQEVGTTEVKYKKYASRQTSPVYDIANSQVNMIKYADGTQDVFPVASAPAPAPNPAQAPVTNNYYSQYPYGYATLDTNSSITGAYMYFGGLISPLNGYDGTPISTYWQNLYSNESGGTLKLNHSNALMYNFFMGGTLVFHKKSNWSYEFQFEYTPGAGIFDSANFADGTHGSLKINYMLLNDAIQYTRNVDTAGRWQIGGEASLDIGLTFGEEHDVFNNTNNYYPTTVSQDFDDVHVGSHFAFVAKYFVNKAKSIGFEGRLGYRFMNIPASSLDFSGSGGGYNGNIDLSGPFMSVGLVIRLRSYYSVQVNDDYYYGY